MRKLIIAFLITLFAVTGVNAGFFDWFSKDEDPLIGAFHSSDWNVRNGTYIEVSDSNGLNWLIKGTNKYLNWNTTSGSSGYGVRDNAGTMEIKNSGGSWGAIGSSSSPLTTKGDIYVYSSTDTRLPVGTNDQVLVADSGEVTGLKWVASAAGFSDPMTTRGDVIIRDATNTTARLGIGTNGQVLQSDGTDIGWGAGGVGDFLADGSVPMTGALDMAGNDITISSTLSIGDIQDSSLTLKSSNANPSFYFNNTSNNYLRIKIDDTNDYVQFYTNLANGLQIASGVNLEPETDSNVNLGSATRFWSNIYSDRYYVNATAYLDGSIAGATAMAGDLYLVESNKELRFYEGANYVGFEAPALIANQIWVLPSSDGNADEVLTTNGSGTLAWASGGATTALDNLASVAINTSLISDTDNTDDLGSDGIRWRNIYAATAIYTDNLEVGGDVDSNLSPASDSFYTLGATTMYWSNTYSDRYYVNATAYLDGTTAGKVDITGNVDVSGTITGDLTGNVTGNADTVTTNANLTGDVTSTGNATAIAANVVDFGDIKYDNTLAGNPALGVDECYFIATATGGGFICEGSIADTNEQLYKFPDANGTDTTESIAIAGGAYHDGFSDFVANEHLDWIASVGTIHTDNYIENATHTGDVTGSGALTIQANKVLESHLKAVDSPADEECLTYESTTGDFEWQTCGGGASQLSDLSDVVSATNTNRYALMANGSTGYVGRALVEADISDLGSYITASSTNTLTNKTFDANGTGNSLSNVDLSADMTGNLPVTNLNSGTNAGATTFWRGDGTWVTPSGSGDVSKVGTPVDNQVGVWTGDGTIEGTTGLTYNGSNLLLTGDIGITGTRITKGWFTDLQVTNAIAGSITGNSATVTNATLTTALTINTGTVTLTGNVANTSVLTIGAGAVSVSGSNTGDQTTITGNAGTATALETARTIGGVSFNGTANIVPNTITVADTADATSFVGLWESATGDLAPKTDGALTYNAGTGALTATSFVGALTGEASTVTTITGLAPDTATTQASQPNITSLGTLTSLDVDNININLNTISSTAGTDLLITPLTGQQLILDGLIVIDNGVLTGATSITSTGFTGALTGNATTATSLFANGANCSAGNYPLGVDASGAVESCTADSDTTYTAGGTLLDLTGTTFSINEGTLTDTKGCIYTTASGLVCNSTFLTGNETITLSGEVSGSGATAINTTIADSIAVSNWNLTTPTITTQLTLTPVATPVTDADGEIAIDIDGWGTGYDAIEFFNSTASAYVVATTASDVPTNGQVPKWNTGGTITWEDDSTGAGSLGSNLTSSTNDILSDTGTLLWGGTGNTNNENLTWDFETTANIVALGTSTGLTGIDFASINADFDSSSITLSTVLGVIDAGGATSLEIPNGATPTVNAIGEIALDTTSDQLKIFGASERVLTYQKEICMTLEDPVDADDNIPIFQPRKAILITDVVCRVDGGTNIPLTISDGTNALEAITCLTTATEDDGSITNGAFTALERMEFDLGTPSGTNTWLNFCITYTITAD